MVKGLILVGSGLDGFQLSGSMSPTLAAYVKALQGGDIEQALERSLQIFTDGERRQSGQVNPVARERTRIMSAPLFARPQVSEAVPHGHTPPARERLGEIHVPTLAIVGSEDNAMMHDIAALFVDHIPGSKSVVIPDAGHHPNLEHPELFNEIVANFLKEIE